ncbi:hypothetical protein S83_065199, partial [Arachis hypogaea]
FKWRNGWFYSLPLRKPKTQSKLDPHPPHTQLLKDLSVAMKALPTIQKQGQWNIEKIERMVPGDYRFLK